MGPLAALHVLDDNAGLRSHRSTSRLQWTFCYSVDTSL